MTKNRILYINIMKKKSATSIPASFLKKTYDMLEQEESGDLVS